MNPMNCRIYFILTAAVALLASPAFAANPFDAGPTDPAALPEVPTGFKVSFFAKEPLVRNPSAMAFDRHGRLFVGMGPQYRKPEPNTPPDNVVILLDTDGDGVPDTTKVFATGFNCIQGLAWHGRDLWVANSPDLTIVRDLDGDDEADEYERVYSDLGNLEHAIHGLNWGPDGKLYMSKGNSKGLTKPEQGRLAPKLFRDLWGVTAPPGSPDMLPARIFKKGEYKHAYHDPRDDWGREGGVLRCDDGEKNLEIVSRGCRNPWDIAFDAGFNWLGTDNDQDGGDRVIMPFYGAHFGWGHAWSPHWTGRDHLPTVPMSGPLFDGSGTGIVYYDSAQFPEAYRGGFFIGDWLFKKVYFYKPRWDGAMIQPAGGTFTDFAKAGRSLFRPTDMEVGPDGALYVLGWGTQYGVQWGPDGKQANEGRVFRIAADGPAVPKSEWHPAKRDKPYAQWTFDDLAADLGNQIPVWRVDAADELVRRGPAAKDDLLRLIARPELREAQQTWALWTLGRITLADGSIDAFFTGAVPASAGRGLNVRIQAIRILAYRIRQSGTPSRLPDEVTSALEDPEPRIRFEAVQAAWQAKQIQLVEPLKALAANETDRATFYAAWNALRDLAGADGLKVMLADPRGGVRRAALLGLLDLRALNHDQVNGLVADPDAAAAAVAALWLAKEKGSPLLVFDPPPGEFAEPVDVKLTAAFKPSVIRYTLDGKPPTPDSEPYRRAIPLSAATTLRAAIYVDGKPIGPSAEAVYRKVTVERFDGELKPLAKPTLASDVLPLVKNADAGRGRALFFGVGGAGCANCHRADGRGKLFGPDLTGIGERNDPANFIQSILEPNAQVAEGFATQFVTTRDGTEYMGILREETATGVTLVLGDGQTVRVDKASIAEHKSLHSSAMPEFGQILTPQHVADLTAFLLSLKQNGPAAATPATRPTTAPAAVNGPTARVDFAARKGQLDVTVGGQVVATYVYDDAKTLRPFFHTLKTPSGVQVTRNHPPIEGKDAADHADMHPGLWMAFGDLGGNDFWRNKGPRVVHDRFVEDPKAGDGRGTFAVANRYVVGDQTVCRETTRYTILARPAGYLIFWDTTLSAEGAARDFGTQEEMGLGVRIATPLTVKTGHGRISNSLGGVNEKGTWGRAADWCDYSGTIDGRQVGVTLMAGDLNLDGRRPWFHTRDYGLMVANLFGPKAGGPERLPLEVGRPLHLRFGVLVHDASGEIPMDLATEFAAFTRLAHADQPAKE